VLRLRLPTYLACFTEACYLQWLGWQAAPSSVRARESESTE